MVIVRKNIKTEDANKSVLAQTIINIAPDVTDRDLRVMSKNDMVVFLRDRDITHIRVSRRE
tara:strand:+ start:97 stop:279 length:183 start_codon:yes stop_codon:yes gene_type:complete